MVGDAPTGAATNAQIQPPIRAIVVETSTKPDHRTKFHEAVVEYTEQAGFLVKLPTSVSMSREVHQFLLLGYEIAFELLH